jgi:hypothetical protein
MSDERRPPSDDELRHGLSRLGADYEPDLTSITQRIDAARARGSRSGRSWAGRSRADAGDRPGPRRSRPVLLPAAGVLLVVGGIVLATSIDHGPDHRAPAASTVPIVSATATPPPPTTSVAPTRVGSAVSATVSATPSPTATKTQASADPVPVSVRRLTSGSTEAIDLAAPPLLDWVAVGTRADLKQVRFKGRTAAPLVAVQQSSGATSTAGPFRSSWDDGVPEQDHSAAPNWLTSDGTAGMSLTLAGSDTPRTVVLYAGAEHLDAELTISGPSIGSHTSPIATVPGPAQGLVITVRLPATPGPNQLTLGGTAKGSKPLVFLAALTIRPTDPA